MSSFKFDKNYPGISIYKALTNKELTEEEKAEIIAEAIESITKEFPNLKNVATKQDLSETELRLLKEIKALDVKSEQIRSDLTQKVEEVRSDLTQKVEELRTELKKDIKQVDEKIEEVRLEVKDLDLKLTKEIEKSKVETIKWVTILMIGQIFTISGIVAGIFKFFVTK